VLLLTNFTKWILKKKDPCKKCLVRPVCDKNQICDSWKKYVKLRDKLDDIIDKIETVIVIGCVGIIFSTIVITFLLGLYQWYQIFASIPLGKWLL